MTFAPLGTLPGWEATPGHFALCYSGRLRFRRVIRRIGDRLCYRIVTATPRGFDKAVARFAADLAAAADLQALGVRA